MENYTKGKNVEEPLERDRIPIPNLPQNFLWMQVRGGSKIRNLLSHALNEYEQSRAVVWTGFGQSVGKAITCAEIMKRESGDKLHAITKLCYRLEEEYWDPVIPDLDQIVVKRKSPMIHILLSLDPLNSQELGYQAPGATVRLEQPRDNSNKNRNTPKKTKQFDRTPTKEFAALQMGSKNKKRPKRMEKSDTQK